MDASTWYADSDGDGYGDESGATTSCTQPKASAADGTDCNDGDEWVHPSADEVPGDRVDQDCDGKDPTGGGDTAEDTGDGKEPDGGCDCSTQGESKLSGLLVMLGLGFLARRLRA